MRSWLLRGSPTNPCARPRASASGPIPRRACAVTSTARRLPDYKRGTPFKPGHDVHADAGMTCTDCHKVAGHKFARGSRVMGEKHHAWERQDVEVDCVNCHGPKPHPEWPDNPAFSWYNEHAAFTRAKACQHSAHLRRLPPHLVFHLRHDQWPRVANPPARSRDRRVRALQRLWQ